MKTAYAAWRATYTRGRWVVLGGPTSMIICEPAPAAQSELLNSVWDELLTSASITRISAVLTNYGLDRLPNLAVLFWDDQELQCLLRGRIRVLDADSGEQLAAGAGARTWYEATLDAARVEIVLDDVQAASMLQLPLVAGAVEASTITIDTGAPVELEAVELGAEDEPTVRPEPQFGGAAPPPFGIAAPAPAPELAVSPPRGGFAPPAPPSTAPVTGFESTEVLGQRPGYAPGQEPGAAGLAAQTFGQGPRGNAGPWGPEGFAAAAPPPPPTAVAIIATSAGDRLPLIGPILVGRAPNNAGDSRAELLRVPSPNHDISRTHLRLEPGERGVTVVDLDSTNGTIVTPPGGPQTRLEPGQGFDLPIGGLIDLGDDQIIELLPPQ